MNFVEAVRACLANYVVFGGRARRSEYWYFFLFTWLAQTLAAMVDGIVFGSQNMGGPLAIVASLGLILPSFAAASRRLHDTGKSAWWILLILIPLIGVLALIYLLIQPSQPQSNAWGPDPASAAGAGEA